VQVGRGNSGSRTGSELMTHRCAASDQAAMRFMNPISRRLSNLPGLPQNSMALPGYSILLRRSAALV